MTKPQKIEGRVESFDLEGELYELAVSCRQDDRSTYDSQKQIDLILKFHNQEIEKAKASEHQRCVDIIRKEIEAELKQALVGDDLTKLNKLLDNK